MAVVESYTSQYSWKRKEAAIAGSEYGAYIRNYELPDRDVFRLRWRVLKRHEGFKEYCCRPNIEELEKRALIVGYETQEWLKQEEYLKVCLVIFGNIHKLSFWHAWCQYQFAFAIWQTLNVNTTSQGNILLPFFEITPGTPAPKGRLNISIDPSLSRKDISRFFEKFVTKRRKHISRATEGDPHRGYFCITEKRVDFDIIERYLAVWDLKVKYPPTWWRKAPKRFLGEYTGSTERNREKAYKDLARAKNIIEWAIRGRFPCTKPIK